jgi:hypothetical protein
VPTATITTPQDPQVTAPDAERRYELTVQQTDSADSPRAHADCVGTLVQIQFGRYVLPREGELPTEIGNRLTGRLYGDTPQQRITALTGWLTAEHGATVVLPVWMQDGTRLRLTAGQCPGPLDGPADPTLVGVIYDTPRVRDNSGIPLELVEAALRQEVSDYDRWINDEVFEWRLGYYDPVGDWHQLDRGIHYDHTHARRAGEAAWREHVGSLYTEAEPLGPSDVGDAGGDQQVSAAYSRRFVRKLTDGQNYGVIDIECYVVATNSDTEPGEDPGLVLTHLFAYTVCADPTDLDHTEIFSDTRYHDIPLRPGQSLSDETVRRLSARLDPAQLDWDGEQLPYFAP